MLLNLSLIWAFFCPVYISTAKLNFKTPNLPKISVKASKSDKELIQRLIVLSEKANMSSMSGHPSFIRLTVDGKTIFKSLLEPNIHVTAEPVDVVTDEPVVLFRHSEVFEKGHLKKRSYVVFIRSPFSPEIYSAHLAHIAYKTKPKTVIAYWDAYNSTTKNRRNRTNYIINGEG